MPLTLKQAAVETGLSKPGILKSIKNGKISAKKNEQGQWEIEPAELFRVYPQRKPATTNHKPELPIVTDNSPKETVNRKLDFASENEILRERLKLREEKIGEQKEQLEDLRTERDDWKKQAQQLTLTYQNNPTENRKQADETISDSASKNKTTSNGSQWITLAIIFAVGLILLILLAFSNKVNF